jgi:lysophospholipase L1-like esterase
MKSSLKNNIYNLFLITIAILFSFILSEILLRFFWLPNQPTNPRLVCEYDAELGWRKIPNKSVLMKTKEYAVNEHINIKGLRGTVYPYNKKPASYRVLLLGDSFVEGYSVDDLNLFSNLLEERLKNIKDKTFEVINMGTGGYSTDQEYLLYSNEGNKYKPDLVILFFYYNDLLYNIQPFYSAYPKPLFIESQGSLQLTNVPLTKAKQFNFTRRFFRNIALIRFAKVATDILTQIYFKNKEMPENETDCFFKNPPEWVEKAWHITELIINQLNSVILQNEGKLLVINIPAIFNLDTTRGPKTINSKLNDFAFQQVGGRLREICMRNSIDFVDLTQEFMKDTNPCSFYYPLDGHWNANGHHKVANILAREIRKNINGDTINALKK